MKAKAELKTTSFESIKRLSRTNSKNNNFLTIATSFKLDKNTNISTESIIKQLFNIKPDYKNTLSCIETGELKNSKLNRYVLIGFNPYASISCKNNDIKTTLKNNVNKYISKITNHENPLDYLQEFLAQYATTRPNKAINAIGSAFGFFAYDTVKYIENIPTENPDQFNHPDFLYHYYKQIIQIDRKTNSILCAYIVPNNMQDNKQDNKQINKLYNNYYFAKSHNLEIIDIIKNAINNKISKSISKLININLDINNKSKPKSAITDKIFKQIVNNAKNHLNAGNIFQMVPSRRFETNFEQDPLVLFENLKQTNPAPYHFYFPICVNNNNNNINYLIGASPEKLVSLNNNVIKTDPIAGTRPRGMNPKMDAQLAKDLKNDPKEISEHMMLVDLSRNDLGKVSEIGSVKISEFKKIKKHASVMHLTSVVTGVKKPEFKPIDVFKAVFPAGTLTGAPKVKAMQLIDEMETCKRGIYGGAIGFINHKDHLDLCIGIRMIILSDNKATVQAGAGIVLDSCPQSEADETRHKVMGLSKLLNNINKVYNNI